MSRVGQMPIPVPSGVKVQIKGSEIAVEGSKGKLAHVLPSGFKMEQLEGHLLLKRPNDEKRTKSMHGLHKTLVYNMIKGVTEGFSKQLVLVGVGYKASVAKEILNMFVGYSHPINFQVPEGITIEVPKPTQVVVTGIDKCLVGQVAAQIRGFAPPEPYKGKGIKYSDEVIRRKAGKAVA